MHPSDWKSDDRKNKESKNKEKWKNIL
jgi:hypothetical protein